MIGSLRFRSPAFSEKQGFFGPRFQPVSKNGVLGVVGLLCLLTAGVESASAAEVTLSEGAIGKRAFSVETRMNVKGQLLTSAAKGKVLTLDLNVQADFKYRERQISGAGRDAKALRSLRHYETAHARIKVADQDNSVRLSDKRRLIVAQGEREGAVLYCQNGSMTSDELELLRIPGDSLAAMALFPPRPVSIGDIWTSESWALQMLTRTDALVKGNLTCRLESIRDNLATVTFKGKLEGATAGASTELQMSGSYVFDLKERYLKRLDYMQKEKRAIGTVTPGLEVTANLVVQRRPIRIAEPLNDAAVERIPLEPNAHQLQLQFRSVWNVGFYHDRKWHLFHQSSEVAVLRLLDRGSLIAQCNIRKIASAQPGHHTPEKTFQEDIRRSLGANLKNITRAELLKSNDKTYRYRVTAIGQTNGLAMTWIYYLCADPKGRQVSMVFSVDTELMEKLANRDLAIVSSLWFDSPKIKPASIER